MYRCTLLSRSLLILTPNSDTFSYRHTDLYKLAAQSYFVTGFNLFCMYACVRASMSACVSFICTACTPLCPLQDFLKSTIYPVLIISYEMFLRLHETLKTVMFDLIICDEGHRLKNIGAKTTSVSFILVHQVGVFCANWLIGVPPGLKVVPLFQHLVSFPRWKAIVFIHTK